MVNQQSNASVDLVQTEERVDYLERQLIANSISIDGIPVANVTSDNDDILVVFERLCSIAEIPIPQYNEIYKIKQKNMKENINKNNNNTFSDGSIIVKFKSRSDKIKFLTTLHNETKRKLNGKLTLKDIGYDSNNCVYIHVTLTKNNYKVFRVAMKAKKESLLTSVFINNGRVFANKGTGAAPIHIFNLVQMAAIIGNNDGQLQMQEDAKNSL